MKINTTGNYVAAAIGAEGVRADFRRSQVSDVQIHQLAQGEEYILPVAGWIPGVEGRVQLPVGSRIILLSEGDVYDCSVMRVR